MHMELFVHLRMPISTGTRRICGIVFYLLIFLSGLMEKSYFTTMAKVETTKKSTPKVSQLWINDINSQTTTDSVNKIPQRLQTLQLKSVRSEAATKKKSSKSRVTDPPETVDLSQDSPAAPEESEQDIGNASELEASMDTVVCPTITRTVYLRPKTKTRTLNLIRSRAHLSTGVPLDAAGQAYDYVSRPDTELDLQTRKKLVETIKGALEDSDSDDNNDKDCGQRVPAACGKPSITTTQFIYTTSPTSGGDSTEREVIKETVSVPVTVYQEPVTRIQTVTVTELQPSIQYPKGNSDKFAEEGSERESLAVLTVTSTVTVRTPQFCPAVSCKEITAGDTLAPSVQQAAPKYDINPTPIRKRCQFPASKSQQFRVVSADSNDNRPMKTASPEDRWKRQLSDNEDMDAKSNLAQIMRENQLQYPSENTPADGDNAELAAHPYPHHVIQAYDPIHPAHQIRPRKYREHNPNAPAHAVKRPTRTHIRQDIEVADSVQDTDIIPDGNGRSSDASDKRKGTTGRIPNYRPQAQSSAMQPYAPVQPNQMEPQYSTRNNKPQNKRYNNSHRKAYDFVNPAGNAETSSSTGSNGKGLFKAIGRSDTAVKQVDDEAQTSRQNTGHFIEIYC